MTSVSFHRCRHASIDGRLEACICCARPLASVSIIIASGHVEVAHDTLPENGLFSEPYPPTLVVRALDGIAQRIMR
jgi:hypothetical protein